MSIAVMILSNERGRDYVGIVSESEDAARDAVKVLERGAQSRFLGIESEQAIKCLCRAWEVMGDRWMKKHGASHGEFDED